MARIVKLTIIISLLLLFLSSCDERRLVDGEYRIGVLATNDLHGRFFDSLYVLNGEQKVHPYSLTSISTKIRELRASLGEEMVVLIDVGDHLQGDNCVYYYNFVDTLSPHIFSKIVNYLSYDAVVVGNHDIEAGHAVYDRVVEEMEMPYLAANAISTKTGEPYFEPYSIIETNGIKIAIVGMTNPNIPSWLSPDLWEGMEFQDILESITYWVEYIDKKESPHITIAALHAGLGEEDIYSVENPARYIAKNVKGLDIVFASHDHKLTNERVFNGEKEVLVLESASKGSHLSVVYLDIVVENGEVTSIDALGEVISMDGIVADESYRKEFEDEFLLVKNFINIPIGSLKNDISSKDAYFGSSAFMSLIHSLQLESSGADISFAAPLSFNSSKSARELNFQDLLELYPYENQLYVISMTGLEIKNYLEYSYSKWVHKYPSESGHMLQINEQGWDGSARFSNPFFNFDSAAGVIYEVDITKGDGERVNILSMSSGVPFYLDKMYRVALTSYRASGGGNLLSLGAGIDKEELKGRESEKYKDIRELLYDKIKSEGTIEAHNLNNWKFVPDNLVKELSKSDYNTLFF